MNLFQILSCSSDLGNCCSDKVLASLLKVSGNIISIIQIVVPIILMLMLMIDLAKMMSDPDNKKGLKSIRNKFIAAFLVFMIPTIINATINIVSNASSKSFDFARCMKEARNVKLSTKSSYINPHGEDKKTSVLPEGEYDKGTKKSDSSSSTGAKANPGSCTKGDSNVKIVSNDSNGSAKIVGKANGTEVVNYAKSWMGKLSYNLSATGELKSGGTCSCSHFVYQVLKHFNIIQGNFIKSTVWGSCNVDGTVMYSDYSKLVPGDIVFMNTGTAKGHVGIYAGNGSVVDCNVGAGVTTSKAKSYTSYIHLSAYD